MDQSQQILVKEIKDLEDKYRDGNRKKVKTGLLVGAGVAAVGAMASVFYAPESLIEYIPWEVTTQLLVGNVGLATLFGIAGYKFTDGKEKTSMALEKAYGNRIDKFLKKINKIAPKTKADFIFNLESTLYPTYQRKTELQAKLDAEVEAKKAELNLASNELVIKPLNMKNYINEMNKTFLTLFKKPIEERPVIETINISNAELTDKQFEILLNFGLGCCGTKKLILSQNRLDLKAIQGLKEYIVNKKEGFHSLKVLDLSHNNIPEEALTDLRDIVKYLGIKELNISGNPLNRDITNANYISPNLVEFLKTQMSKMPTLKVLKLSGINLTDNFEGTLNEMISQPGILRHLDITNNPNLGSDKLRKLFENGYQLNQSLEELLVDKRDVICIEDIVNEREEQYRKMQGLPGQFGEKNAPRIVYLLNRFMQQKHLKADTRDLIEEPLHNVLETNSNKILMIRSRVLGIPEDYSIPVTKKEYVCFLSNNLNHFYIDIVKGEDDTILDPRLFSNEEQMSKLKALPFTSHTTTKKEIECKKNIKASDKVKTMIKKIF